MTDTDAVEERLRAVERAVAEGDADADLTDPTGELESRIDDLEATTTELESGLQAVRGYVGQVKSVDDEIERRADAAAAAVDDAEERIAALERRLDAGTVDAGDADTGAGDTGGVGDSGDANRKPSQNGDRSANGTAPSQERQPTAAAESAHEPPETGGRSRDRRRGDRPNARRRPQPRSGSRRPAEPPSHSRRTRSPAEDAANERYDHEHRGCPYCGGAGDGDRDAETDRSAHRGGTKGSDGAPVDDVDERGVVARLRDAL